MNTGNIILLNYFIQVHKTYLFYFQRYYYTEIRERVKQFKEIVGKYWDRTDVINKKYYCLVGHKSQYYITSIIRHYCHNF